MEELAGELIKNFKLLLFLNSQMSHLMWKKIFLRIQTLFESKKHYKQKLREIVGSVLDFQQTTNVQEAPHDNTLVETHAYMQENTGFYIVIVHNSDIMPPFAREESRHLCLQIGTRHLLYGCWAAKKSKMNYSTAKKGNRQF